MACGATVSSLASCYEDPGSKLGGGKFLGKKLPHGVWLLFDLWMRRGLDMVFDFRVNRNMLSWDHVMLKLGLFCLQTYLKPVSKDYVQSNYIQCCFTECNEKSVTVVGSNDKDIMCVYSEIKAVGCQHLKKITRSLNRTQIITVLT